MYGPSAWGVPNSMMEKDHIYNWDVSQNVSFPAQVTATKFNGNLDWSKVQNKPSTYPPAAHDHNLSVMINAQLSTGSATPQDADYYISQYAGGGTTTTTYQRRPVSALWTYIKGKADAVYASKSHTHNYAGSLSAGGSANSAVKLDTSAGSTTQPVYFKDGEPTVIGYTISSSVPANAKFTDTTYDVASSTTDGLMSSDDKKKLNDFSGVVSITKSIQLTTDWQDVGISGEDLETGTYVVQVSGLNPSYTSLYYEIYSGIMTWYASETNDLNNDEIFLHNAGHASNSNAIYLRTSRRLNSNGGLHLQIACKVAATGTDTLTFKFRRLI